LFFSYRRQHLPRLTIFFVDFAGQTSLVVSLVSVSPD